MENGRENLKINDFHALSKGSFILIITVMIGVIIYGIAVSRPLPLDKKGIPKDADLKCYQTIVEKIQAGENYYDAAGQTLRKMGYTTASVFNWRLPTLAVFLGHLPSFKAGQIVVLLISITTLLLWMFVFHQNHFNVWQVFLGGLILSGPVIYSLLPGPFLSHEFWAGTLIALSIALHALGWRYSAVLVGVLALILRELSLPFVCVMMFLAFMEGQKKEALLWFLGIAVFGAIMLIHWAIVSSLITANDFELKGGWIVFGGWPFVLNTAQMHPLLILAPQWVPAVILPVSVFGLAGWRNSTGLRVLCTVVIYVLAFSIAGRSFNIYWGLMYAFIMPLGLLFFHAFKKNLSPSFKGK